MAESELFRRAYAALGSGRAAWDAAAGAIATAPVSDPLNEDGARTLANILSENQLSADPAAADPGRLTPMLVRMGEMDWPPSEPKDFEAAYRGAVEESRLGGTAINESPTWVHRYMVGSGLLERERDVLRFAGRRYFAERLGRLIIDAHRQGTPEAWNLAVAFVRDPDVWASIPADQVRVGRNAGVFVTFDADQAVEREHGRWMHTSLALWKPYDNCFLWLRWDVAEDDALLFPTVADAGWYCWFRGVPAGAPCGRTQPHADGEPSALPQPETVVATPTLERVRSQDDFRFVWP